MNTQKNEEILSTTLDALKLGGVILSPTDTIWGLGCDMTNHSSVKRIYEIKQRPADQPLLILVHDIDMLKRYVNYIHPRIETLLSHHMQPLTLIYEANEHVPKYLQSAEGTIGIRIIKHDFCEQLIKALDRPLVSTSANISGAPFPKTYEEIDPKIKKLVDHEVSVDVEGHPTQLPSIVARYNHKGELDFLRS